MGRSGGLKKLAGLVIVFIGGCAVCARVMTNTPSTPSSPAASRAQPVVSTSAPPVTLTHSDDSGPSDGSVHVRGYYRKDGTYVAPHTRSAARRR
jgi:hypothetical protein